MKNLLGKALCVAMLAVPFTAMAADDDKGCDSVNWGEEVLTKFPNAQKGCHDVMKTENGEVYAHYVAEVVKADAESVTVNLIEPGTAWSDRVNVFDLRVAKILRFGRTRTNIGVDIYNLLNSSAVLTNNAAFNPGGTWLVPTSVITPRFAKISASFDF